jgi:hypothetical protein
MRHASFALPSAGLVLVAILSAGCSAHVSIGKGSPSSMATTTAAQAVTVDKDRLAALGKEKLEQAAGQESESVECDGDIDGTPGATQRCVLTALDGTKIGVTATVISVKGDDVNINFKADDHPMG